LTPMPDNRLLHWLPSATAIGRTEPLSSSVNEGLVLKKQPFEH
jgi:hypothetical protein